MAHQYPSLNSRQKELLQTLLMAEKPVSYKQLSEIFKLSTRTIQRETSLLKAILNSYGLKIGKKIGSGLEIKGPREKVDALIHHLNSSKAQSAFSPEERQEGICYDLLVSKEPIKQFVFSKNYGVTETTVSHDLDKVSSWLENGGISLIRTPGVGVYLKATEQQRRMMLSRLLHKDVSFEEWLHLFHEKDGDNMQTQPQGQLNALIRNRLLKFVHSQNIQEVERVVRDILGTNQDIVLTDRNYVNLIVHLMLTVERIKEDGILNYTEVSGDHHFDPDVYLLAEKIVTGLEKELDIEVPDIEVEYIALHLAGARVSKGQEYISEDQEEFTWIELANSFIGAVEHHLKESFQGDNLLQEGLVAHFAPAFNRLKYGLQIHNPMLKKIKERYPDIFAACEKACQFIEGKVGYPIPEDEIGYLTMHIGASLIRKKERFKKRYRAVVICASGLGTSTYLASRIRSEMENLSVVGVVSSNHLKQWLRENEDTDILISTVNLPFIKNENVVIVSPFLQKEDVSRIQYGLEKHRKQNIMVEQPPLKDNLKQTPAIPLAKYGEGMMKILQGLTIQSISLPKEYGISSIISPLRNHSSISGFKTLCNDLEKREQKGGFVIGGLAMLHTRSEGVKELLVAIIRISEPVQWFNDIGNEEFVQTILLLAAPKNAPKEHIKMISEVSAMLIDHSFIELLEKASEGEVKEEMEIILSQAYERNAIRLLEGAAKQ
jgi:mannitol operon transcriptional antiterminator